MDLTALAVEISALEHVQYANAWDKVEGKERVYITTEKFNGGKNYHGGKGYETCFVDLNTKTLVARGEAGAATRNALKPVFEKIAADHDLTLRVQR